MNYHLQEQTQLGPIEMIDHLRKGIGMRGQVLLLFTIKLRKDKDGAFLIFALFNFCRWCM